MNVKHITGWQFEVQRNANSVPHLVDLAIKDPRNICDCQFTYCRTAMLLKRGDPLDRSSYCCHVREVALWLFDQNILTEARKGL
jgi:hypothetical protein